MAFALPQGWYRNTIGELLDNGLPPVLGPLTAETAWRYIYACVLWAEPKGDPPVPYLHLNDMLSKPAGKALARRGAAYLAEHLTPYGVAAPHELVDRVGVAYNAERVRQGFEPLVKRDPNVTGRAFEVTLQMVMERVCGVRPAREPKLHTLSGFELAPAGYHSQPDLALFGPDDFRLLISSKWTLRKERIGTYLHEAYFYKQRRSDLQVAFVVSEFNRNILFWLANDPLVDRVYHVNQRMLLDVHAPFQAFAEAENVPRERLLGNTHDVADYQRWLNIRERVFDLTQLFVDIERLKPTAVEEPDDDGDDEVDADEVAGL